MDYSRFTHLELRRRFWTLVGATLHLTDPQSGEEVGFIRMKAWKLREDIRLYTDESMQTEVMRIHARNIIDFGATYDVVDSASGSPIASLARKGFKSLLVRDHWDVVDRARTVSGSLQETSSGLALLRRWIGVIPIIGEIAELALGFAPQTYDLIMDIDGTPVKLAALTHRKNPLIVKLGIDMSMAPAGSDPRLAIAAATLLSIIDANKNN